MFKLYKCNAKKNKECLKTTCYRKNGVCGATSDITMAKKVNGEPMLEKLKLGLLYDETYLNQIEGD